jgi:hypothetical protein
MQKSDRCTFSDRLAMRIDDNYGAGRREEFSISYSGMSRKISSRLRDLEDEIDRLTSQINALYDELACIPPEEW